MHHGTGISCYTDQIIGLAGYIGPLTLTLTPVRSSVSPTVRCISLSQFYIVCFVTNKRTYN